MASFNPTQRKERNSNTVCQPSPLIQVATSLTSGRMKISLNQEVYLPLAAPFPLGP